MTKKFSPKIRLLLPILLNCKHQIASEYTNRIVLVNYWIIIPQNVLHHYPMNDRLQSCISYLNKALLKFCFQIIQVQPFKLLNIPLVWYHNILLSCTGWYCNSTQNVTHTPISPPFLTNVSPFSLFINLLSYFELFSVLIMLSRESCMFYAWNCLLWCKFFIYIL